MMMGLFLGLIDREIAKQILQAIEPQSECIGSGYSGISRGEWFKAWALVDPQHTLELLDQELAAQDPKLKRDAQNAAMEVVELWLTVPSERCKNISRRYSHMVPPNEEN